MPSSNSLPKKVWDERINKVVEAVENGARREIEVANTLGLNKSAVRRALNLGVQNNRLKRYRSFHGNHIYHTT